ncbi:hypothetical protein BH11ARM2_BH11ARM2_07060 [soil metagenome]
MSYTVGDGMVSLALAGGVLGYLYMKGQVRQSRMEIIHQERMAAMEKGIPLPEFPLEPERGPREGDPRVIPLLGLVLSTLSVGAMIVLSMNFRDPGVRILPLPFTFLGVGFLAFYFMKVEPRR